MAATKRDVLLNLFAAKQRLEIAHTHDLDLRVENHGSVFILQPMSARAREWLEVNVERGSCWVHDALVCEPRYVEAIVADMIDEGMEVE